MELDPAVIIDSDFVDSDFDNNRAQVPAKPASVIWMHGLGADGHDFEPIVDELDLPSRPVRFIFPHAPRRPVTINGGMLMRAWYDISDAAIRREDASGVRQSQAIVEQLIAGEVARGVASTDIVLAGFSQGGAIALQTALRHPARLAGVMALSTYLPLADTLAAEASAANRDLPIFMAHGKHDPVVVPARAGSSRDTLQGLGYAVQWQEYTMPHAVCPQEIVDISRWLCKVLG
jgi:phospholipase/carboxylesterase